MDNLKIFKKALLIRRVEETLLDLFNKGLMNGTVHTCIGQEFSGVAISEYLSKDDYVLSNHRGHGHYISRTEDIKGLFAEVTGRKTGCSGGIGGSQHLFAHHFFSNGIQGGMTPIGAGIALAQTFKKTNNIVVSYIGDGTFGEGILYETFNISSKWNLPLLFVVENNEISQSTSIFQTMSGSIEKRSNAFDIKYLTAETNEVEKLFEIVKEAVEYVRENNKPLILEIKTNRLFSHSKGDDNRDFNQVNSLKEKDPINKFAKSNPEAYNKFLSEINASIDQALESALSDELLTEYVNKKSFEYKKVTYKSIEENPNKRGNELIYDGLKHLFSTNDDFVLLGEDIETSNSYNPGEYGGAFKVTRDLSLLFQERIKNTPISEAAITGIGTGLALAGMKPIVEIMFGDFSTLIFDQLIQHACKFRLMYNNQIEVPLIIRTPMGGGRGYGPTHSQSIEKHFLGITDLSLVALNHRINPEPIFSNILTKINHPHLIIENKLVYTQKVNDKSILGYSILSSDEDFPTVCITPEDETSDCTILCYGGVLQSVEDILTTVFEEEEISCEVICPMLINPINIAPIIDSVNKSKRLLIIEEGTSVSAWGSEILALLTEHNIVLKKMIRMGNNTIIPCSGVAEKNLLPNNKTIIENINRLFL
jgi:2-oxoisovalerate dehydrogenase E1 component